MSETPKKTDAELIKRDFVIVKVHFPKFGAVSPTGFYIATGELLEGKKKGQKLAIKGKMPHVSQGMKISTEGYARYNTDRGEWFMEVTHAEEMAHQDTAGIAEYLSRECPHIGGIKAEEIATLFGVDFLVIMEKKPERLEEVGISGDRAIAISKWAADERVYARVKKYLYSLKIGPATITKLIKEYGNRIQDVLKTNPFCITKIEGIGFLTACTIANALGIPKEDPGRIQAGILFAFEEAIGDKGHSCMPQDKLMERAAQLLSVSRSLLIENTKHLIQEGRILKGTARYESFCNPAFLEPVE